MKASFLAFFLVVICVYAVGNVYLYVRGWQALEILGKQRIWFTVSFWFMAVLAILTQVLRVRGISGGWFDISFSAGTVWIAVLLYGFLAVLLIDILRITGWAGHITPHFVHRNYLLSKVILFGAVCMVFTILFAWGYRNAHFPRVTHLSLPVDKHAGQLHGMRVAMVSDIHLGHTTGRKFLSRVVDTLNRQKADIILLVGDTFDGGPGTVIRKNMGIEFDRLKSRYGTFAVSGNHEYIGEMENKNAVKDAFAYLESHGVKVLSDTVVLIDSSFYIAGRTDRTVKKRKTVSSLLGSIDRQLPVILMDHQPYNLQEAEQAGADLQFSGHTHHGQMWPLNYITKKIYESDWGFLQKGKSYFYVSCGVGVWGPPVRTAGYSEVVVIDLKFNH